MNSNYNVLITEDNKLAALNLKKALELKGHSVAHAPTAETAKEIISNQVFDIAFIDLDLEEPKKGFELIPLLVEKGTYPVILSGHDEDEYVENGYDLKCSDYIVKPFSKDKLDTIFQKYFRQNAIHQFTRDIKNKFLTTDPETISELKKIEQNIGTKNSFYITGPTGTGKSLLSKIIHGSSYKSYKNYIHVNCSAIPKDLIESELFGTKSGAFTGATDKKGKLLEANEGTLHLDEISSMPMDLQEKLLLALENNYVIPVGGTNADKKETQFQLITSTCESLEGKVNLGEFREDLYYRIMGEHIHLKALSDRNGEIEYLVHQFIDQIKSERGFVVKDDALQALINYRWFGNVREMVKFFASKKELLRPILRLEDLPSYIKKNFNRFSSEKSNFISESQINLINKVGYSNFKSKFEQEVVKHFYHKNSCNKLKTMKELGMTQYSLGKIIQLIEDNHG